MEVLLLAENWPPRTGGIENYLTNIAKHLPAGQVAVDVVEPDKYRFFWPVIRPKWLPLFVQLWRKAKKEPWDITLCGKALFEGLVGYYLNKSLGIPYIVFTYSMEITDWSKRGGVRRKLVRVLKNADRVVYINDETKKDLLRLGVTEQQLVKIWPGVAIGKVAEHRSAASLPASPAGQDSSSETAPPVLEKHNIRQPYILTVARLVPRKGIDLLIEAFGRLDQTRFGNLQLVIAGEGPEREKLEEVATKAFMQTSVKFLGHVPDEDLLELYKNAEFFALTPKSAEGFGIVYLEAAAHALPAVGTMGGGVAEAVLHKETGLVVQAKAGAVREAFEYFLTQPEEKKRMGASAQKRVEKEFRWNKRIVLVKAMLDAVMQERAKKDPREVGGNGT